MNINLAEVFSQQRRKLGFLQYLSSLPVPLSKFAKLCLRISNSIVQQSWQLQCWKGSISKTKTPSELGSWGWYSKWIFHFSRWETQYFEQVCFHCIISWFTEKAFYWQQNYSIYVFNPYKATCYYLTSIKDQQVSRNVNLYHLCVTEGQYQQIRQDNSTSAHTHPSAHRKVKYIMFPNQKNLRNQSAPNTQPRLQILCRVNCMWVFPHQQEELLAWSWGKHRPHTTSLSLNWRDMDFTDGPLGK